MSFESALQNPDQRGGDPQLREFLRAAGHDLHAPLRGLRQLSEWLYEDEHERLSDQSRQHLELMRDRAERLQVLIDNVLAYSRLGAEPAATERVDTGELVSATISALAPCSARFIVAENLPSLTTCGKHLALVFRHLLSNAVQHAGVAAPVITVAWRLSDEWLRFEVADNGQGIEPQHHERIFAPFQSLQPRDGSNRCGLGLAFVSRLVALHGGNVAVESRPGEGARFSFSWCQAPA